MTPAPISVERYTVTGDIAYPIHEDTNGEYVLHSDYAALLHQLAERDAEVERLTEEGRRDRSHFYREQERAEAAERSREEFAHVAPLLLDLATSHECDTLSHDEVSDLRKLAAFLAASGGKSDG